MLPRYVPDPRASDEAWIVTTAVCADLGRYADPAALPAVTGADDARRAAWLPAAGYAQLAAELAQRFGGQVFAAHQDLLGDVLDGPGEAETFIETYIDDHLADRSEQQLRDMAADYLRLVAAVELTMADLDDFADDQLSEVQRLTRYLDHLSQATRGACDVCRRAIFAPHQTTELPRRRWWHPRRWLDAAADALTGLRYGGHRTAHTSCLPPLR